MGVNTFLLDRRTVTLLVGGSRQTAGTLRQFFKLTELDDERAAELEAAALITPSPAAALVMDITDLPLAGEPDKPVAAHLVLGWDDGLGSVTDFGWDYLPRLGYAVRDPASWSYTLHECRSGPLHPIDALRARELGLLDAGGELIRHGQPRITACRSVKPWIPGYAEAECMFDSGAADLAIARRTVEEHRVSIRKRTGVISMPALARLAIAAAWDSVDAARRVTQ
jgi:hypothetical protein